MEFVATCLFGLEHLLGEEIDALGYRRTQTIDGRVSFEGDVGAIARCNLWLRTAERLYVKLGSYRATTFTELFDGCFSLPWEEWIGKKDAFPVTGHAVKSKLFSIPDCQKIVKKAVVKRLGEKYNLSWLEETGISYPVEFFILNDEATLMIDTSGVALHKRGYRLKAGVAPLRETLAAAMAKIARPREDVLFWDPFCGSGTIPIEAAMIMKNIAPGMKRDFISKDFPQVGKALWKDALEEAKAAVRPKGEFEAYASDWDSACVDLARQNAARAGVGDCVKCFEENALRIRSQGRRGTVVCNPPYGERLGEIREVEELYRQMGKHFDSLSPWQIYVLTSHEGFQKLYGRRADKVRRLYNGMIRCNYYQYFKPIRKEEGR